jgi:hypothetical protein
MGIASLHPSYATRWLVRTTLLTANKKPATDLSARAFGSCHVDNMPVICPTCQIFSRFELAKMTSRKSKHAPRGPRSGVIWVVKPQRQKYFCCLFVRISYSHGCLVPDEGRIAIVRHAG